MSISSSLNAYLFPDVEPRARAIHSWIDVKFAFSKRMSNYSRFSSFAANISQYTFQAPPTSSDSTTQAESTMAQNRMPKTDGYALDRGYRSSARSAVLASGQSALIQGSC